MASTQPTTANSTQPPRETEPAPTQRQPMPITARTDTYRFRDFASI